VAREVTPERPLSVVVLGNSLSVLSIPERTGASDGTYAEVLRDALADAGVPGRVALEGRWFDFAVKGFRRYQESVRAHLPDVLVLQYGLNESQPWLLPVPVVRHFVTDHQVATRTGRWYRDTVVPPVWKAVRGYRRWAAPRVGTRTWQTTPHRFGETMRQLIRAARYDGKPLVLVLDVNDPGGVLRHFLPGMEERHAVVQQVLRDVVAGFGDPEVRLVESSRICRELGDEASYDGMHYSPLGHRAVGEALAAEVLEWLGRKPG
jgi:lysophospholipase L1-like esterase